MEGLHLRCRVDGDGDTHVGHLSQSAAVKAAQAEYSGSLEQPVAASIAAPKRKPARRVGFVGDMVAFSSSRRRLTG